MAFWIINIFVFLISAFYIYKISYFYDYRYIGNVIRFISIYYFFCSLILKKILQHFIDYEDVSKNYTIISFIVCLIICVLFRNYLVNKFGKEERFANSDEIEDIGDLKK